MQVETKRKYIIIKEKIHESVLHVAGKKSTARNIVQTQKQHNVYVNIRFYVSIFAKFDVHRFYQFTPNSLWIE